LKPKGTFSRGSSGVIFGSEEESIHQYLLVSLCYRERGVCGGTYAV
jgi:hypothetical protein